jgi:hypothetical protein
MRELRIGSNIFVLIRMRSHNDPDLLRWVVDGTSRSSAGMLAKSIQIARI